MGDGPNQRKQMQAHALYMYIYVKKCVSSEIIG